MENDKLVRLSDVDDILARVFGYAENEGEEVAVIKINDELKKLPAVDAVEVCRCSDCKYWRDEYVKQNDGRERQYRDDDNDGILPRSVTVSVGVNMGSMCRYEDGRGWSMDKSVFRKADDFCSRGERRPCSYEQWRGIVDGFYPDGARMDGRREDGLYESLKRGLEEAIAYENGEIECRTETREDGDA